MNTKTRTETAAAATKQQQKQEQQQNNTKPKQNKNTHSRNVYDTQINILLLCFLYSFVELMITMNKQILFKPNVFLIVQIDLLHLYHYICTVYTDC